MCEHRYSRAKGIPEAASIYSLGRMRSSAIDTAATHDYGITTGGYRVSASLVTCLVVSSLDTRQVVAVSEWRHVITKQGSYQYDCLLTKETNDQCSCKENCCLTITKAI